MGLFAFNREGNVKPVGATASVARPHTKQSFVDRQKQLIVHFSHFSLFIANSYDPPSFTIKFSPYSTPRARPHYFR
jgi:hypothetical protein